MQTYTEEERVQVIVLTYVTQAPFTPSLLGFTAPIGHLAVMYQADMGVQCGRVDQCLVC